MAMLQGAGQISIRDLSDRIANEREYGMNQADEYRIQVVVADDHPVVRQGLRAMLSTVADREMVGEAATGAEAVAKAGGLRPEVILLDIQMPEGNGLAVLHRIRMASPATSVIMMTMHDSPHYICRAIESGDAGYQRREPTGTPQRNSYVR